jgi:hypothetical protein
MARVWGAGISFRARRWFSPTQTRSGPSNTVEYWKPLGGQCDNGFEGSKRPRQQVAVLPNTTHGHANLAAEAWGVGRYLAILDEGQ